MVSVTRLLAFFKKPDGPIGMLVGGFLVAMALFSWAGPKYQEIHSYINKVPVHTKKISEIKRQQQKFEKRFKQVEGSQDKLEDNQLLLICTSPYIGDSWKQKKNCSDRLGGKQ